MPHIIVEYTDNLADLNFRSLLKSLNHVLVESDHFPTGGIRSRAVKLTDYVVADGTEDDAFVHIELKVGAGRSEEVLKATSESLFEAAKTFLDDCFKDRYLALSLEVTEFRFPTQKKNNIHNRYTG
ncbi:MULTISPECIES: 5-carboxymethyl-2-hydroxymuconate Delta-isomerase [Pontibacillus]|uniref:5-carboxymethyl-2-hydroxymuconate Delta-isomerase n=1 Tax=Pontibacillus chungwhensis TaxID=265426 RepID=A0ABY8V113_9BACI|nr:MULTISPECIES: 5-carboxymethyl-2-hydroxymuconate Delta-isomerase [Pontibacillus]MCD5322142.1 5-carboxymethyl-2-hydroxymuconate Delta-isomerase [Pontibacillus sp. HN14]WIF99439.1 5-carboxymethyl-2-hydroxymuconate Delta-isomerase [Pontibacillus chungwhensis]